MELGDEHAPQDLREQGKQCQCFYFWNKQKLTFPDSLSLPSPIIKQQSQTHRCWDVCVCVYVLEMKHYKQEETQFGLQIEWYLNFTSIWWSQPQMLMNLKSKDKASLLDT